MLANESGEVSPLKFVALTLMTYVPELRPDSEQDVAGEPLDAEVLHEIPWDVAPVVS